MQPTPPPHTISYWLIKFDCLAILKWIKLGTHMPPPPPPPPHTHTQYYTIIDFNEVDIRIYLPEKVIIHRGEYHF